MAKSRSNVNAKSSGDVNDNATNNKRRSQKGGRRNSSRKNNNSRSADKRDNLSVGGQLSTKGYKNNPNWYFKDAAQAEVMSRIQMNGFAGTADSPVTSKMPTIQVFYTNPCPGVTPNSSFGLNNIDTSRFKMGGINRAAQKLWYILTAKSGRAAGYTKPDVALLLLSIGAMIETYEFIRRVFGISYVYSQRNRTMPTLLWKAMNIDYDDYRSNAANYLKRMNSLMAVMNELPIMGNIAFFAKCQDIYQNIYMDYPSEMAQLYMFVPSTTWILEENDGFSGGSYLRTVDMCLPHVDDTLNVGTVMGASTPCSADTVRPNLDSTVLKTLKDYIDVFEDQINALMFSSSFSVIYSDILRAFDTGTLSRWSFDYIDEKYVVTPIYNEAMLWQIHNATFGSGLSGIERTDFHSYFDGTADYKTNFKYGTPLNDVYQWAADDVVVYNPVLWCASYRFTPGHQAFYHASPYVVDFPNDNPTVEERIEYTRFKIALTDNILGSAISMYGGFGTSVPDFYGTTGLSNIAAAYSWQLPDHWIEYSVIWFDDGSLPVLDVERLLYPGSFNLLGNDLRPVGSIRVANEHDRSKFHHAPIVTNVSTGITYGTPDGTNVYPESLYGEINAWTTIEGDWFRAINEMIYVDLFDIR